MSSLHTYPKVYNLGHAAIADLLLDDVIVQEKVDGSQFSFGLISNQLHARSHGAKLCIEAPQRLFRDAIEYIVSIQDRLIDGYTYRGEVLHRPKHNVLAYSRTPKHNIILFDINNGEEHYLPYNDVVMQANALDLEVVPLIYSGRILDQTTVTQLLDRESVLGGVNIEGVVIKNYTRFGRDGHVLMGKYVSEKFKEKHKTSIVRDTIHDALQKIITSYKTEACWQKAVQHLDEQGLLTNSPRDIGTIIQEVQRDVLCECANEIRELLFNWARKRIVGGIVSGLPEWYKSKLMEKQFE